jgi:hypothetical protein
MFPVSRVIAIISLCAASFVAAAAPVRCDNCANFEQAARNAGAGIHEVYDIPNGVVRRFSVDREQEYGRYYWVVAEENIESELSLLVLRLAEFYWETGGTMKGRFPYDASGEIADFTAFDLRNDQRRWQFINWCTTASSENNRWVNLIHYVRNLGSLASSILTGSEILVRIDVRFADGSTVTVEFSPLSWEASIDENSLMDAMGNRIPGTAGEAEGRYFGYEGDNGDRAREMRFFLQRLGASFDSDSSQMIPRGIICVSDNKGGVRCYYTY